MADSYASFARTAAGKAILGSLKLPVPEILERWDAGRRSFINGRVLVGMAPGGTAAEAVLRTLAGAPDAQIEIPGISDSHLQTLAAQLATPAAAIDARAGGHSRYKALVFDATAIGDCDSLHALWSFFHPVIRQLDRCGRVVVIGRTPETATAGARTAQRALEGFARSVGKELRAGSTAQLVYVAPGAEALLDAPLRFCLSPKSAYVCGQVLRISMADATPGLVDWDRPLATRKALVTGAARGIGAAIADVLARDGARVTVLDVAPASDALAAVAARVRGDAITLDITASDAPERLASAADAIGGFDIVVHNAGVTRDKTLGRMPEGHWTSVLDINIASQLRINERIVAGGELGDGGRIISISSISGIAGNAGQTNYGCSKAAVIGMVDAWRNEYAARGITINAVAPGFIETEMTATMPFMLRQGGRRMNVLKQGGLPVDVAEAVALFACPAAQGLTGNVLRVCGQMLLGA